MINSKCVAICLYDLMLFHGHIYVIIVIENDFT